MFSEISAILFIDAKTCKNSIVKVVKISYRSQGNEHVDGDAHAYTIFLGKLIHFFQCSTREFLQVHQFCKLFSLFLVVRIASSHVSSSFLSREEIMRGTLGWSNRFACRNIPN